MRERYRITSNPSVGRERHLRLNYRQQVTSKTYFAPTGITATRIETGPGLLYDCR
jgi:hypothetical protein